MSVLLSVLLLCLWAPLARFYQSRWETLVWAAVLLNLARAVAGHFYRMDRLPFRRFDYGLEDDRARPGGSFAIEVTCEARKRVVLEEISIELQCVDQGEVLHRVRGVMASQLHLAPGEARSFKSELQVPEDAPSSYKDAVDRIRWRVSLLAVAAGWGELKDEFEVTVAPR